MRRNSTVHAGVRTVCAACLILFASSACGLDGESTARRVATVRDSADIEIVENYDPILDGRDTLVDRFRAEPDDRS